jgi:diphthamide synthase (EF-2-diphthine--ammonia ligase)
MTQPEKVLFTWSGGKDSALALYEIQMPNGYEISALLTIVTEGYERISMHGVRSILLERQAESIGLPVEKIYITGSVSDKEYEAKSPSPAKTTGL